PHLALFAFPALPAEVYTALDQRLPMRLAAALEPVAGALALKACVLDGAAHPSSLPFTVWLRGHRATKHRPKIGVSAPVCVVCGRCQYIEKSGFCKLQPFAAVYPARSLTAKTGVRVQSANNIKALYLWNGLSPKSVQYRPVNSQH